MKSMSEAASRPLKSDSASVSTPVGTASRALRGTPAFAR